MINLFEDNKMEIESILNHFYIYDPSFYVSYDDDPEGVWVINGLKFKLVRDKELLTDERPILVGGRMNNPNDDMYELLPFNLVDFLDDDPFIGEIIKFESIKKLDMFIPNIEDFSECGPEFFFNTNYDAYSYIFTNDISLEESVLYRVFPSLMISTSFNGEVGIFENKKEELSALDFTNLFYDCLTAISTVYGKKSYATVLERKCGIPYDFDLRDDKEFFYQFVSAAYDTYPCLGLVNIGPNKEEIRDTKYVLMFEYAFGARFLKPDIHVFRWISFLIKNNFKDQLLFEFAVCLRSHALIIGGLFGDMHHRSVRDYILRDKSGTFLFELAKVFMNLDPGYNGSKPWCKRINTSSIHDLINIPFNGKIRPDRYSLFSGYITAIATMKYYGVTNSIFYDKISVIYSQEQAFLVGSSVHFLKNLNIPESKDYFRMFCVNEDFSYIKTNRYLTSEMIALFLSGQPIKVSDFKGSNQWVDKIRDLEFPVLYQRIIMSPVSTYKGIEFLCGSIPQINMFFSKDTKHYVYNHPGCIVLDVEKDSYYYSKSDVGYNLVRRGLLSNCLFEITGSSKLFDFDRGFTMTSTWVSQYQGYDYPFKPSLN